MTNSEAAIAEPDAPKRRVDQRRLAFGALAVGVTNVVKVGLQVLMLPLMARLLGPAEFGLYALALPTIGLLLMLADGGLANSMAREPNSNVKAWSSAFWAMLGAGIVLAALAVALSFAIAEISHQPRLPSLMALLAVSFFALVWTVLPTARLMRDARLEYAAFADLASTLLGAAVAVLLALRGAGAWSLAAQFVATILVRAIALNMAAPVLPRLHFDWRALRSHLGLGGAIVGSKLTGYLGPLAENALIGRWLGAPALGSYSLSNQIPRFLNDAVGNPLWASLYVQALHHTAEETAETYYRLTRLYALMVIPAGCLLAAGIGHIVLIFLGPHWEDAGVLLAILLPAGAVGAVGSLTAALLLANGKGLMVLSLGTAFALARVGVVALSPFYGLRGAAIGLAVVAIVSLFVSNAVASTCSGVRLSRVLRQIAAPVAASAIAGGLCWAVLMTLPVNLVWVVACEAGAGVVFVLLMLLFDRRGVTDDLRNLRQLLGRRAASGAESASPT